MEIISNDLLTYTKIARYVATDEISGTIDTESCNVLDSTKLTAKKGSSPLDFFDEHAYGIQAVCVEHNSQAFGKELIVAYRSTSNMLDWESDVGIANVCLTPTGAEAVRVVIERLAAEKNWVNWFEEIILIEDWGIYGKPAKLLGMRIAQSLKYYDSTVKSIESQYQRVIVVGHSLGAFLASHVAYKNNLFAYAFDGPPGVKYSLVGSRNDLLEDNANKIFNHRLKNDPVSAPGQNIFNFGNVREFNADRDELMLDPNGFPYGHMGFIANWKQKGEDPLYGWQNHELEQLIKTEFNIDFLLGISQAPTTNFFW